MLILRDRRLTQEYKLVRNQILFWVKPCADVIGGKKECEIAILSLKGKEPVWNDNTLR